MSTDAPTQVTTDLPAFAAIPRWLVEDPDVSANAVRAFAILTRYAGLPNGAMPALGTMAKAMGVSANTMRRALHELRDRGVVTIQHRRDDRGQTSNLYHLTYHPPATDGRGGPTTGDRGAPTTGGRGAPSHGWEGKDTDGLSDTDGDRERPQPDGCDDPATPATKVAAQGWDQARDLCDYLVDAMIHSGGPGTKKPTVTQSWVATMEKLVRLDERDPDQVRAAIDWAHRGPGQWWSDKVLSPDALRRHYEKMRRQASRNGNGSGARPSKADLAKPAQAAALRRIAEREGAQV